MKTTNIIAATLVLATLAVGCSKLNGIETAPLLAPGSPHTTPPPVTSPTALPTHVPNTAVNPDVHQNSACHYDNTRSTDLERYVNESYGFELFFSKLWSGYRAVERSSPGGETDIAIEIPEANSNGNPDYREAFTVSALQNSAKNRAWVFSTGAPHPLFLAETSKYLFGYWWSQDPPYSLTDCEISRAISSFQLIAP